MAFNTFTEWNAVGLHVGEWGQATGLVYSNSSDLYREMCSCFNSG